METREITRNEWKQFLDDFSKQHQGRSASVQIIGDDLGSQQEATSLPFVGISADDSGSAKGGIEVMLGTERDDHLEHLISDPTHLWLKSANGQGTEALEIEASDGTKTILQLK